MSQKLQRIRDELTGTDDAIATVVAIGIFMVVAVCAVILAGMWMVLSHIEAIGTFALYASGAVAIIVVTAVLVKYLLIPEAKKLTGEVS